MKSKEPRHIHCLICGAPVETEDYNIYICNTCVHSFPDDYLMYRINCYKNNIFHNAFDLLEERLCFGKKVQSNEANEEIFL